MLLCMVKLKDIYMDYALAFIGLVLTAAGLFSNELRLPVLLVGVVGLALSIGIIKANRYLNKVEINSRDIEIMKKELNYHRKYVELKEEVKLLREFFMMNKKGTAFTDFLTLVIIFVMIYVLLISLFIFKL